MSSYLGMCVSRELRSCSTGLAPCKRAFGCVQRGVEGGVEKGGGRGCLPPMCGDVCIKNNYIYVWFIVFFVAIEQGFARRSYSLPQE